MTKHAQFTRHNSTALQEHVQNPYVAIAIRLAATAAKTWSEHFCASVRSQDTHIFRCKQGISMFLRGGWTMVAAHHFWFDPICLKAGHSINVPSRHVSTLMTQFFQVPFNFGHTVSEKVLQHGIRWGDCGSRDPEAEPCRKKRMGLRCLQGNSGFAYCIFQVGA